jgi:hypothetical protein
VDSIATEVILAIRLLPCFISKGHAVKTATAPMHSRGMQGVVIGQGPYAAPCFCDTIHESEIDILSRIKNIRFRYRIHERVRNG